MKRMSVKHSDSSKPSHNNRGSIQETHDVTLSEIIGELESGVSVNADDASAAAGEPGVLKVSSVCDGRFFPEQNKRILPEERERARVSVRKGDLIISRANTFDLIGACGMAFNDYPNLFLSDKLWRVVLKGSSQDCVAWLNQVLNSTEIRVQLRERCSGTSGSMKNISKDDFLGMTVRRPPCSTQKAIAALLSAWDTAIGQTDALIAAKERLKQGLLQESLRGKERVKRSKGTWQTYHIGELLREVNRHVVLQPDCLYRLVSVRRNSGGLFDREVRLGSEIGYSKLMTIETGDFLIARRQVIHGAMTVVEEAFDGAFVSDAYATLVPKDPQKLHMPFLDFMSQTPEMYYSAFRCSYGVAIEKMVFHLDWFMKEQITIPKSLEEQERIAGLFVTLNDEIRQLNSKLDLLKQQKRGLMQQLLTGKIPVSDSLIKRESKS